ASRCSTPYRYAKASGPCWLSADKRSIGPSAALTIFHAAVEGSPSGSSEASDTVRPSLPLRLDSPGTMVVSISCGLVTLGGLDEEEAGPSASHAPRCPSLDGRMVTSAADAARGRDNASRTSGGIKK